jgi:hypothetical protein
MDDSRFDTLTRSLTTAGSRRRALTTVLGGALGLVAAASLDDAVAKKKPCPPCKKRKKGKCKAKLPDGTACSGGACQGGSCVATAVVSPPPPPFCSGKPDSPPVFCGSTAFDANDKSTWYFCKGGACGLWPDCEGRNIRCAGGTACCSWPTTACGTLGTCGCSSVDQPCTETFDCCSSESGATTCVGFVCKLVEG